LPRRKAAAAARVLAGSFYTFLLGFLNKPRNTLTPMTGSFIPSPARFLSISNSIWRETLQPKRRRIRWIV
jgi:hypothetical protein